MKTRIAATAIVLSMTFAASAHAAPTDLDGLLTRLVSQAVSITAEQLNNELSESILNAAYHVDSNVKNAKVEINDVTAELKEEE